MADGPTHAVAGIVSGAGAAAISAMNHTPLALALETAGGAFGGYGGARAPDVLDPPTSPNHRHIAHGIGTTAFVGFMVYETLVQWQAALRARADQLAAERPYLTNDLARALNQVAEWVLRFLAGTVIGFPAGYVSHLVLDAGTPRGLPLFTRDL